MNHEPEIKNIEDKFSDFIESAAHDLHAPLRKLSVMIDRIFTKHADQFDKDAREYAQRAERCIKEMQMLIDGLTELARANDQDSKKTRCDLNEIVKGVLESMNEEISERGAKIQLGTLPQVEGNQSQLKQLFTNLLDNALKFHRKGSLPNIEISATDIEIEELADFKLSANEDYEAVEIIDNGIGFDASYRERIFEPFVRLHSKSEYAGNGLGLSICKKIVIGHGGMIYARSNGNSGSRFILILRQTH